MACGVFTREVEPKIKATYIDSGQVRLEFRHLPYQRPESTLAAEAAACTHAQGKFWAFHAAVYGNQSAAGNLADASLLKHALAAGVDEAQYTQCVRSRQYKDDVAAQKKGALDQGLTGTPTFFVNGQQIVGTRPWETWVQVIDAALAAKKG